jgi:kynurenine formamidase
VAARTSTGWSRHWGTPDYRTHPGLSLELVDDLLAAGVRTVGIDTLSVDVTPAPGQRFTGLPAHRTLAHGGAVIAENLTNLEQLLEAQATGCTIDVSLLPLRLSHGDGAPIRAVAAVTPP